MEKTKEGTKHICLYQYDGEDKRGTKHICLYQYDGEDKRGTKHICLYQYDMAASLKQILDKNFNETLLLNLDNYHRVHFPFQ